MASGVSECVVCFKPLDDPVALPCEHVLCLRCACLKANEAHAREGTAVSTDEVEKRVDDYVEAEAKSTEGWATFECPTCSKPCPFDLSVARLSFRPHTAIPASEVKKPVQCHGCEINAAAVHCEQCDATFCEDCAHLQHKLPKFQSHKMSPMPLKSPSERRCEVHGKPLDLYCLKDSVPICSDCLIVGNHRDQNDGNWIAHEFGAVLTMAEKTTRRMEAAIAACDKYSGVLDEAYSSVLQSASELFKSCEAAKANVNAYFDDLIGRLEQLRQEKLDEVDGFYKEQHDDYELQIGLLGSARAFLKVTVDIARRVLEECKEDNVALLKKTGRLVSTLEASSAICADQLTKSEKTDVVFYAVKSQAFIEQLRTRLVWCGDAKFHFSISESDRLVVSRDRLTVTYHEAVSQCYCIPAVNMIGAPAVGSKLPNHGIYTWRLRMSKGGGAHNSLKFGVCCGDPSDRKNFYGWSTHGDRDFRGFLHDTPEAELTLDADTHKLTMRNLNTNNGSTHVIDNIPADACMCVYLYRLGNTATLY